MLLLVLEGGGSRGRVKGEGVGGGGGTEFEGYLSVSWSMARKRYNFSGAGWKCRSIMGRR